MLDSWGIKLLDEQKEMFEQYVLLLQEANKKINLTSIVKKEEILEKHFLDSLSIVNIMAKEDFLKPINIIDIGAGAGFPGLPLKIVFPQIKLTLVESTVKKVNFINEIISKFKLDNTTCIADRAENVVKNTKYREQYDIATARAVSGANTLAEYLLPLLKIGGYAVLYKAKNIEEELQKAVNALQILGGEIEKIEKIKLGEQDRSLVLIKKVKNTPDKYPRRIGLPEKKPL